VKDVARKAGKALSLARTPRWRRALRKGVAATIEHLPALRTLRPRTVIDIGANKGQFALLALELFPEAHVHSFEPLPAPRAKLRTALGTPAALTVHEVALGPERAELEMHIAARDDSSSLRPITALQSGLFHGTEEVATQTVPVLPLDEALPVDTLAAPVLMKLDVQGYELDALMGARDVLGITDWVYVECSFVELYGGQALFTEIVLFLADQGFVVQGVYNTVYGPEGEALQADVLFVRRPAT